MNRYAYIRDGVVWEIVESQTKPDWPPTQEGVKPLFVEIPENEIIEENFIYDAETGDFSPYEGYGEHSDGGIGTGAGIDGEIQE